MLQALVVMLVASEMRRWCSSAGVLWVAGQQSLWPSTCRFGLAAHPHTKNPRFSMLMMDALRRPSVGHTLSKSKLCHRNSTSRMRDLTHRDTMECLDFLIHLPKPAIIFLIFWEAKYKHRFTRKTCTLRFPICWESQSQWGTSVVDARNGVNLENK